MLKDGVSPQPQHSDTDHNITDSQPDSSNAAADPEELVPMDTTNQYSNRDGSDSYSDHSSDCEYPSQSTTIPTCVVAPTSSEADEYIPSRKQREFIPENKKDDHYWEKRRKNNDAARRSREKRRYHDMALENRIVDLTRDNCGLRNELFAIKKRFGIPLNETFVGDDDPRPPPPQTQAIERSLSPLGGNNSVGGVFPGSQARPSGNMGIGRGNIPSSVPPPLLHMAGGIPVGINFGVSGQIPLYVSVPTSENIQASVPQMPSAYRDAEEDHPPPAHSRRFKREMEHETVYGSDRPPYYPGSGNDAQDSPASLVSTSIHSSAYSRNFASAAYSSTPNKSDYSDDDSTQDEPLSLTVNKSYGVSGNESSNSTSSCDSILSQSPPATALPHKLRHKSPGEYGSFSHSSAFANPLINGLAQLSEIALAQSGPLPLLKSSSSGRKSGHKHNPRSQIDPKYAERRRRNNEAARKCRENRKSLTQIREAKSEYLSGENGKLRDELDGLQSEMKKLKNMLDHKRHKGSNSREQPGGD